MRGNGYEDGDDSYFEERYEGMSSKSDDEEVAFNPGDYIKGVKEPFIGYLYYCQKEEFWR